MSRKLEIFFKKNRDEFDELIPDKNILTKIIDKMDIIDKKKSNEPGKTNDNRDENSNMQPDDKK